MAFITVILLYFFLVLSAKETSQQGKVILDSDLTKLIDITDFTFIVEPESCQDLTVYPELVIIVPSAPRNMLQRNVIRDTWGNVTYNSRYGKFRVVFLIGCIDDQLISNYIRKEGQMYQDVVQGSFVDSYHNLTYKHVMGLKWFKYSCSQAKFLLKVDDDILLNTPLVLSTFNQKYWESKGDDFIMCHKLSRSPVMRDTESKWYVSPEEYPGKVYPEYCSGYAIFYGNSTVLRLYEAVQDMTYFWIDDVFVSGLARQKINVTIEHLDELTVFKAEEALMLLKIHKSAYFRESFVLTVNLNPHQIRSCWYAFINEMHSR